MGNFVRSTQTFTEHALNAAHNLPHVDRTKSFTSGLSAELEPGTLLKENAGNLEPWIQGTDAASLIVGVYAGHQNLDTANQTEGLARVFGPINADELVSWTAADGSTTADPTQAALDQLEAINIFAM